MQPWDRDGPGVIELPSGLRVRGRGLRRPMPAGLSPTLTIHLTGRQPPTPDTGNREWIRWPDFWVPTDFGRAAASLRAGYDRALTDRVEISCGGGVGRTGTALAAWAVFDDMPVRDAVDWVRQHYHPDAVEVPWQRWFLRFLATPAVPTRSTDWPVEIEGRVVGPCAQVEVVRRRGQARRACFAAGRRGRRSAHHGRS